MNLIKTALILALIFITACGDMVETEHNQDTSAFKTVKYVHYRTFAMKLDLIHAVKSCAEKRNIQCRNGVNVTPSSNFAKDCNIYLSADSHLRMWDIAHVLDNLLGVRTHKVYPDYYEYIEDDFPEIDRHSDTSAIALTASVESGVLNFEDLHCNDEEDYVTLNGYKFCNPRLKYEIINRFHNFCLEKAR